MYIEILKNHIYNLHIRPLECADSPTHGTYFYSCQRCAHNSKKNHYSLPQVWWVEYSYVIFIYFIKSHVERVLENINSPLFAQIFNVPLT